MARKRKQSQRKVFNSPGTVKYVGKEVSAEIKLHLYEFNEEFNTAKALKNTETYLFLQPKPHVQWLSVDGVHGDTFIEKLGQELLLHPLILEDIVNTFSKPKIEILEDGRIYVIIKMIDFGPETNELITEHTSFLLQSKNSLISFQELNFCEAFEVVKHRLDASIGKTRKNKADYLMFALMDILIDQYFETIEKIADNLEEIEDLIIQEPKQHLQTRLFNIKRMLTTFRKLVFPLREVFNSILNEDSHFVDNSSKIYFKDLNDHVIQVLDGIEIQREITDSLINLYMTQLSNKMNSVMKTLTVFTAIFMPLTFVVGIYGMNFENMPETRNPNGYFYTLAGMLLIAMVLWFYFKWKKYV